jgi:hypothetical protein
MNYRRKWILKKTLWTQPLESIHLMIGFGSPSALHSSDNSLPAVMRISFGSVIHFGDTIRTLDLLKYLNKSKRIFLTFNYKKCWLKIFSKSIPNNTRIISRIAAFNTFDCEQWMNFRTIYFVVNFRIIRKYLIIFSPLKK